MTVADRRRNAVAAARAEARAAGRRERRNAAIRRRIDRENARPTDAAGDPIPVGRECARCGVDVPRAGRGPCPASGSDAGCERADGR